MHFFHDRTLIDGLMRYNFHYNLVKISNAYWTRSQPNMISLVATNSGMFIIFIFENENHQHATNHQKFCHNSDACLQTTPSMSQDIREDNSYSNLRLFYFGDHHWNGGCHSSTTKCPAGLNCATLLFTPFVGRPGCRRTVCISGKLTAFNRFPWQIHLSDVPQVLQMIFTSIGRQANRLV